MQKVVILGAGGLARETALVFDHCNQVNPKWEVLGYVDEDPDHHGKVLSGRPVLGDFKWFEQVDRSSVRVITAVGSPVVRKKLVNRAKEKGLAFCSVVHPNVIMSRFIEMGEGVVITAGNILTVDIRLGNYVFLNLDCTVGHDTIIEAYCNVAPGAHISGNVYMGEGVDLGTGAVVLQGKRIGAWSIIGAGAVVTTDVPERVTAVGIPARAIKSHPPAK